MIKNIFRAKKKYLAFFTVVPLLLITAVVKVPCPICGGTGVISNTGMSQVRIINIASTVQDIHVMEGCLNYRIYNVEVKVTLQNDSPQRDARVRTTGAHR